MKGLIWKDLTLVWKTYKTYVIITLVFLIAGNFSDNGFISLYPAWVVGVIVMNLINMDERSGWDAYSAALPLSRAQLVSAKYLVMLVLSLGTALLYLLLQGGWTLWQGSGLDAFLLRLPMILTVMLLWPAIMLPCVLKLGYSRGSTAYILVAGVLFGVLLGGASLLDFVTGGGTAAFPRLALLYAMPLATAVLFGLSWLLSIRIYKKKEF